MSIKKLRMILKEFDCSSVEELSYEDKDLKITVKKNNNTCVQNDERKKENCVVSPLVGVYYEATPVVREGQKIEKGSTLCVVESMKIMNRISAPRNLIVKKKNYRKGERVEYDDVLFEVEFYD